MTINATENPIPLYVDTDGKPLDNGAIYFGAVDQNPETNPITVYWDEAGTQPAAQPIKTVNGQTARNGAPAAVYAGSDYSNTVRNKKGVLVSNFKKASGFSFVWQLLSSIGSSMVGHMPEGIGSIATNVQTMFRLSTSVTDKGAHPSKTSAENTIAFNLAIADAILRNVPLFVPPIGVYKIRRLASVTGNLTIFSTDAEHAVIQVDADNWPYTSGGEPILVVTGSFRTHHVTWDQNWLTGDVPGYQDDRNPATWGGHWFVQAIGTTSDKLSVVDCVLKNVYRGFFGAAANPTLGGLKDIVFMNNSSASLIGAAQTLIAGDAPANMTVSDNPLLETKRWDADTGYDGNGTSFVIAWGGTNVKIENNTLVGYQLVARGPRNLLWTALTYYIAGEEYLNVDVTYKVTTSYTSGATFGAADLANTITTYNPSTDISVCNNRIQSPVADTAVYGWARNTISNNAITNSGDMGIAASGAAMLTCSGNVIDGVRNGGIDLTGDGIVTCTGNVVVDIARASGGVYSRIDTINPNVFASNGGFNLAAITIGLPSGSGVKDVTITGNTCRFKTLPPISDPGPNNGGLVRAQVIGIYSATSSNPLAFNSVTATGNRVSDYVADMPGFMLAIPMLRFYNASITGSPKIGEVFASSGGNKFVLVSTIGSGNLTFVRKFQGESVPASGEVFTGVDSGAVITAAALPQTTFLESTEAGNFDHTSKHIADFAP